MSLEQTLPKYRIIITRTYIKEDKCDFQGRKVGEYREWWYAYVAHATNLTDFHFYKDHNQRLYLDNYKKLYLTAYNAYISLVNDYWWLDYPYVTDIKIRRSLTDSDLPPLETS